MRSLLIASLVGLSVAWMAMAAGALPGPSPTSDEGVDYGDIAPVLRARCGGCHRPGGGAPMVLQGYEQVRPWARSISRVLRDGSMPPWHADPRYGSFANDRSLSAREHRLLLTWVEAGMPRGKTSGRPAAAEPGPGSDGWTIGEPDLIVELPAVEVPATGDLPYHDTVVEGMFPEGAWIEASEVSPGSLDVVHHVIVDAVPPAGRRSDGDPRTVGSLGGYVPGDGPLELPVGLARWVPAGSRLVFQVHYTPSGTTVTDHTRLGLRFADAPPRHEALTGVISNPFLSIPAGAEEVQREASWTFQRAARLLSLRPHLHLRGRSFEFRARYPDGGEEILLSVPEWSFDWQTTYVLAEPKRMPAGTELIATATWDNSARNPSNPDPTVDVSWGLRTVDEMMVGFFDYYEVSEAEP